MASKYFVIIKLDLHYQRFLRSQFKCESEIFEFPLRHQFNTMLEHFVIKKPGNYIEPNDDKEYFKIALPYFEWKNSAFFRYLSKSMEDLFRSKIKDFYDWIIQARISELMRKPFVGDDGVVITLNRKQCTLVLIEEYGFDAENGDSYERLYKLFTRYKKNEVNRKLRNNKKERVKC